jgi:hypothetical protein
VHSTTRLEISSDIWREVGGLGLICAWSKLKTAMARENGHHDLLLGEEVASSTPHATRRPPSRVAAHVASQRAVERASVAQSLPAPNGPLLAARELLRNPPGEAASPDAQRQWHDDVDRLLNLAQGSPNSAGDLCSDSALDRAVHPAPCTPHL